jgi:hypothetical protein
MIIEVTAGEHIARTAEKLVAAAKTLGSAVEATFNGVRLVAYPGSSVGDICQHYDDECSRSAAERRLSPEGRASAERDRAELARMQARCDCLIGRLPSLDFASLSAVLDWIGAFQPASNRTGVNFSREDVVSTFARHGYYANMNVDEEFDPEGASNVAHYIVGQAMDHLATVGAIHQMIPVFADDWRAKFLRGEG